jgi:uncharacterized delta-60 repeat protein
MRITLLFSFLLTSLLVAGQSFVMPDSTFNGTGRKIFSVGGTLDFGDNIALQPDGKIIMTGASMNLGGTVSLGVTRMNSDGSFDNTFGTAGVSLVDLGGITYQGGFEPEIVVQPDGKILICGFGWNSGDDDMMICRLLANGNIDPSFGTGGKVFTNLSAAGQPDAAYAITTDASGNIYACGSTRTGGTPFTNDVAIIKLTPSGAFDNTFSGDGKLLLDISGSWDFGYGIAVKADGKIIVTGYSDLPADFFAARLLPNGTYDPTFAFLRSLICIIASFLSFTHLAQRNLPLTVTPPSINLCTKQLLHRFHRSGFVSTGYVVNIILSLVPAVSFLSLRYLRYLVFLL